VDIMRTVPGVTVLGTKTATGDGYEVTAGVVRAYGLRIAGLSDPRVYGASGAYGADAPSVVDPLERDAVQAAVGQPGADGGTTSSAPADGDATDGATTAPAPDPDPVDVFALHEPVAAEALREELPGLIRQTVSGHVHAQNDSADVQADDRTIDLVEGSTGAGGLDNIVRGTDRPPIEFSIESVGEDCQFTRVIRFSIQSAAPTLVAPPDASTPQAYGDDVTASTVYFRPQQLDGDRTCGTQLGIGAEQPWPGG
jgi:hypothetical protein